jgi:site-specific DNA-adenine methylase
MYLDPPYPDNNCNYRHNMRSIAEHEALRDWMMTAKSKLILTNYDKPEIRELYKDFNRVSVDFASGMNYGNGERRNKELIITNFDIDKREHEIGLSRWA